MSCQGNGNCPLDNQDDLNKRLNEKLNELEAKLNAIQDNQNNKKPDLNPVPPQVSSPDPKQGDSKDESKARKPWLYAITDIFNNLTKLVPTILNSERGFPALFGYGGLVVGGTCAILIAFGSNKEGLKMIYRLGLLGIGLAFIVFMVWVFWDPDRPGRRKRGLGSGKKKNKQQNADNNIDNSENDDDMKGSLNILEQKIEHFTVFSCPGSGKSSVISLLSFKQIEEQPRIKIHLKYNKEDVKMISKYLKLIPRIIDPSCGSGSILLKENIITQRMDAEKPFSEVIQIDFLFSLSQEKQKIDKIIINSKVVDLFNESDMDPILRIHLKACRSELHNSYRRDLTFNLLAMKTEKEIISLEDYPSTKNICNAFLLLCKPLFAEKMTLESDLKMLKESRTEVNYDIYDSFQINKEKKKSNLSIQKHLFQIPEINRLSRNSTVTKESNIPIHKFFFASQANTNQCSTEKEEIQISISNNQKTKSNKLLRKKIKLNLN